MGSVGKIDVLYMSYDVIKERNVCFQSPPSRLDFPYHI